MAVRARVLGLSVPVAEVLDPRKWRERYAYGVLLGAVSTSWAKVQQGGDVRRELKRTVDPIPDEVIRWHLRAQLSELEVKLGVPMGVVICKALPVDPGLVAGREYDRAVPRLPYTIGNDESWWRFNLPAGVISVERVRAYYFGSHVLEFSEDRGNLDEVRLEWPRQGVGHILPLTTTALITSDGQVGLYTRLFQNRIAVPDFWAVDYTLGPVDKQTGQPGHIEAVLADWVYCSAGIKVLNLASMAVSKGITSTSIAMDGVSRSVSLQASAMYGMNSALEHVYDECVKRIDWKALRTYKRGLRVVGYS